MGSRPPFWPVALFSVLILGLGATVWFLPISWPVKAVLTTALYTLLSGAHFMNKHGMRRGSLKLLRYALLNAHWAIIGPVVLLGMVVIVWACAWGIVSALGSGDRPVPKRLLVSAGFFVVSLLLLGPLARLLEPVEERIEDLIKKVETALQTEKISPLNTMADVRQFSSGRFAVYLRPFDTDGMYSLELWKHASRSERRRNLQGWKTAEQRIALEKALFHACSDLRVDCRQVGVPSGMIRGLEIQSALVEDENWRGIADDLIVRAGAIFLIPSTNPGTLWEMSRIHEHNAWHKTIIMVPGGLADEPTDHFRTHVPSHKSHLRWRAIAALDKFGIETDPTRAEFYRILGQPLQAHSAALSLVAVDEAGLVHVYFPVDALRSCIFQD